MKPRPSFSDLLNDQEFRSLYNDWEWHDDQGHPAAQDIADYISDRWGFNCYEINPK